MSLPLTFLTLFFSCFFHHALPPVNSSGPGHVTLQIVKCSGCDGGEYFAICPSTVIPYFLQAGGGEDVTRHRGAGAEERVKEVGEVKKGFVLDFVWLEVVDHDGVSFLPSHTV
eukprot:Hpha_TRINITY_DN15496_c0_g9::TRINITY_DN15496_c0_g9_i1::g.173345::m.173345